MHETMDANVTARVGARRDARNRAACGELVALMERIAAGQQAALNELYELTVAKLFRARASDSSQPRRCGRSRLRYVCADLGIGAPIRSEARQRTGLDAHDLPQSSARSVASAPLACANDGEFRTRTRATSLDEEAPDTLLEALQQGSSVQRAMAALSPIRRQLRHARILAGPESPGNRRAHWSARWYREITYSPCVDRAT